MSVSVTTKTIDGHEVSITQFYALRGQKIQTKLFKYVLPSLSGLFSALKPDTKGKVSLDSNIDLSSAGKEAVNALIQNLKEDELQEFLLELFASMVVDKRPVDAKNFDTLFIGNYTLIYKLAYEVVMANNFFDLGGIGSGLIEKLQIISPVK
jgi:hypothetical protein